MKLVQQDNRHTCLELANSELVILQAPKHIADTITISDPPLARESTPIKAVYYIDDIARARKLAKTLGGKVYAPEHEWLFKGATVCDGYDCEGNIFQLRSASKSNSQLPVG